MFQFQHHKMVYQLFGRVVGDGFYDVGEIFGGDVHLVGIVIHIPRQFVIPFDEACKLVEEFLHPPWFSFLGPILRISEQIFVKSDEECFQLQQHQLGEAATFLLVKINFQQTEHVVDDTRHDGRVLTATVFAE